MQNAHVESFHGKLRDECLRVSWFGNLFDARRKIASWRNGLQRRTAAQQFGLSDTGRVRTRNGTQSYGKDVGSAHFENAWRFPLSHSHGGGGVTLTNAEQCNGPEVVS